MISEGLRSSTTVQCLKRRGNHKSVMCTSAVKGTLTHPAHVWMLPSAKFPWGRSGWTSSPCYWLAVVGMQWNSKWWETQWDICGGFVLSCSFIALLGLKPKQGCISKFVLMETLNKTSYTTKNGERNVRIATTLATLALIVGLKHHIGVESKVTQLMKRRDGKMEKYIFSNICILLVTFEEGGVVIITMLH